MSIIQSSVQFGGYLPKRTILTPGVWLYLYPEMRAEWAQMEPSVVGPSFQDCGLAGVLPHRNLQSPDWCTPERVEAFASYKLKVCVSLGFLNPPYWAHNADACIQAVECCERSDWPTVGVSTDKEGQWNGHQEEAELLVERVLDAKPTMVDWRTDAAQWAPLTTPRGRPSHPSHPYREFARLGENDIYAMAYGAPITGESARMLSWSRDKSQWAQLGAYEVRGTVQAYHRTLQDHLGLLLSEPTLVYWHHPKVDEITRYAFRVRAAIDRLGYLGPDSVIRFQQDHGLRPDNAFGPLTAKALGLPPPPKGRP